MATAVHCTCQVQCLPHGNYSCCHMATPVQCTCQVHWLPHGNSSAMHMSTAAIATWQLQLLPHGNSSAMHMSTVVVAIWQLQCNAHGNCSALFTWQTFVYQVTFDTDTFLLPPTVHSLNFSHNNLLFPSFLTHCFYSSSHP
jgi:hypothetical protein